MINKLQWLIYHQTKPNQTKPCEFLAPVGVFSLKSNSIFAQIIRYLLNSQVGTDNLLKTWTRKMMRVCQKRNLFFFKNAFKWTKNYLKILENVCTNYLPARWENMIRGLINLGIPQEAGQSVRCTNFLILSASPFWTRRSLIERKCTQSVISNTLIVIYQIYN